MANPFDFLAQAKPAALYRLLERLPQEDAAIVLTGLPHRTAVQIMAYYPDEQQGDLLPAMRDARRVAPERAAQTADRIREMLRAAKNAREGQASAGGAPVPPQPLAAPVAEPPALPPTPSISIGKALPPRPRQKPPEASAPPPRPANPYQSAPPPVRPATSAQSGPETRQADAPKAAKPRPVRQDGPVPWVPRAATGSPINGPAVSGKEPVAGDPFESPLARAGLLDLIGRAQEKLLPKKKTPPQPPAAPPRSRPGVRPKAREGVVRLDSVGLNPTPRVIGPAASKSPPAAPTASGARRMDGKAILAAILREAGPEIRGHVQDDDPRLFKELRGRMFFFDDLIYTEDAALARVFTTAPAAESALALKFAAPALRDRVLRVVSPGRARALADVPAGRAGVDAIERAQKKVLDVALQLQAAGRILIDPRDPDLAGS